jgi:hypothetical protein
MVVAAEDFEWSTARAHLGVGDFGLLTDGEWWGKRWTPEGWRDVLKEYALTAAEARSIRSATYTGRPLGSEAFVAGLEARLGRKFGSRADGAARGNGLALEGQMGLWGEGF